MTIQHTVGPDFICVGMAKAGTGWLFDQLRLHPDFWLPPVKELAYLKNDMVRPKGNVTQLLRRLETREKRSKRLLKGFANRREDDTRDVEFLREVISASGTELDIDSYARLFRFKEAALSGDVTPGYAFLDECVIAKLAQTVPDAKILLLVRNPVDRAWSRLCMWHRSGKFLDRWLHDLKEFRSILQSERLSRESFPTLIFERWTKAAPNLAIRHFFFDDIVNEPDKARSDILDYIGADPSRPSGALDAGHNRKADSKKLELTEEILAIMVDHFRSELRACSKLFGGAAVGWENQYKLQEGL